MKLHEGKVAIITGGNSGIGLATAVALAEDGASVVLADYNDKTAADAKAAVAEAAPDVKVMTLTVNVADEESVKKMIDQTVEAFGRLDYLVNNAGVDGEQKPVTEYPSDVFQRVLDINVNGVFYGMKYAIPVMEKQGGGAIVNTASVLGIRGSNNMAAYVAAKHAVVGLTKVAAIECGPKNIRVNAVNPGAVLTPMVEEAFKRMSPEDPAAAQKQFSQRNPLQRFAKPEEIGHAVSFLLSERAGYLNGQTMVLDGGETQRFG